MPTQLPFIPSEFNYRVNSVVDGVEYIFDVRWNGRDEAWYMDLYDVDEDPIRTGMKIVLGSLIGRRSVDPRYPAGAFVASDLSNSGTDATFDDLGVRVVVFFYSFEELA
jgi:hypothetical protein